MIRHAGPSTSGQPQPSHTVTVATTPQLHSMQMQQQPPPMAPFPNGEPPVNLASKVAEVFLTAGHAFQKLGDLTLQLHTNAEPEECKWTEKDVDQLRDSLTRFAHELDMISQSVQGRTTKLIKTDIKRRHLMPDETGRRPSSPGMKRPGAVMASVASGQAGMMPKRVPMQGGPGGGGKAVPLVQRPMSSIQQSQRYSSMAASAPLSTPLLNDPSHHYISSRGGGPSDVGPSGF